MMNQSPMYPDCCSCSDAIGYIYPSRNGVLNSLTIAAGYAAPCTSVLLRVDGQPVGQTVAGCCGYWEIPIASRLEDGIHQLCAFSGCRECCLTFTLDSGLTTVPSPVITYPSGTIPENNPVISGTARPGFTIRVCVDGDTCQQVQAAADGTWSWQYPGTLPVGGHIVTAVAIDPSGGESNLAYQLFDTQNAVGFSATLDGVGEGGIFRSIRVSLSVESPAYPVTLYYLMLPPGSAVPDAEQIRNYTGPGLEDGTAARGSITLTEGGTKELDITGQEGAPLGASGLVDGYRYDIYLIVSDDSEQSPVFTAENILAMAFDGGRGIHIDPYRIRQLSEEEIRQRYPDLAAGRSPVGVDDTARMLRNIMAMQDLFGQSDGRYGIRNSMALDYQLTSPMDLAGYASANQGTGWWALGYHQRGVTPVRFSGALSGSGSLTAIRNLTVIRGEFHLYEGLFAYCYHAYFKDLALQDAIIRLSKDSDPDGQNEVRVGLLAAEIEESSLTGITVTGAQITISGGIDEGSEMGAGGIAWELRGRVYAKDLYGENIHITVTEGGYKIGGLFGRAKNNGNEGLTIENATLRRSVVTSEDNHLAGIVGQLEFPHLLRNLLVEDCTFTSGGFTGGIAGQFLALNELGSLAENLRSVNNRISVIQREWDKYTGGLFGQYNMGWAHILRSSSVVNCTVSGVDGVGGLAGGMEFTGPQVIEDCHVTGSSVQAAYEIAGGFTGELDFNYDENYPQPGPLPIISNCTVELTKEVSALIDAGGFAGSLTTDSLEHYVRIEDCHTQASVRCGTHNGGGFAGLCNAGAFSRCSASGNVIGPLYVGGFIGDARLYSKKEGPRPEGAVILAENCSSEGNVDQTDESAAYGCAGGFIGRALDCRFSQCQAGGAVSAQAPGSGGFAGVVNNDTVLLDCSALGNVQSAAGSAGGIFGSTIHDQPVQPQTHEVTVDHCSYQGAVQAGPDTGGIGGLADGGLGVVIKDSLVTSPRIAGQTPTGRIVGGQGGTVTLSNNYASTTDVLQDGVQKVLVDDPAGPDGGTVSSDQADVRLKEFKYRPGLELNGERKGIIL